MQNQEELPCPICNGHSYSWGFMRGARDLKYKDDNVGSWEKTTVLGGEPVKARKCDICGNIQLFTREAE